MGHQNQVLGFADELSRRGRVEVKIIEVPRNVRGLRAVWNMNQCSLPSGTPDLVVGAGHGCHVLMCRLKRRFRVPTIVMMKPSLPLSWFDFALIPKADGISNPGANVILTDGALNRVQPSTLQQPGTGLILVGGPSKHFEWSDDAILTQVLTVTGKQPDIRWTIADSRRTPTLLTQQLLQLAGENVTVVPVDSVSSDWLPKTLTQTQQVWVSEDSVSMTYEALTAGSSVGLLGLKRIRSNRITASVDQVLSDRRVVSFREWNQNPVMVKPAMPFCETQRCVTAVLQQLKWTGFEVDAAESEAA